MRGDLSAYDDGPHTVLRHEDGGYSLAVGYPPEQEWKFHVVGHYGNRKDAETAIANDRREQAELKAAQDAQEGQEADSPHQEGAEAPTPQETPPAAPGATPESEA